MSRFTRMSQNSEPPKSKLGSIVFLVGTLMAILVLFPPWESKEERADRISSKVMKKVKMVEPDEPRLIERKKKVKDTNVKVLAIVKDINAFDKVLKESLEKSERLITQLDPLTQDGTIFNINKKAGKEAVLLNNDEYHLLNWCKELSKKTDGRFDISQKPFYDLWKFGGIRQTIANPKELASAKNLVGIAKLELDEENKTAHLPKEGMGLDLRLIYNALLLNQLKVDLKEAGILNYFVFAGADSISAGTKFDHGWTVSLQHPQKALSRYGILKSNDVAVAVNNEYSNGFEYKDKWYHPYLDPSTGQPARHSSTLVVVGKDLLAAKAISISAFLLKPEEAIKHVEKWQGYEVLTMDKNGKIFMTKGMENYVVIKEEKMY